jgi:hypothetical protein
MEFQLEPRTGDVGVYSIMQEGVEVAGLRLVFDEDELPEDDAHVTVYGRILWHTTQF